MSESINPPGGRKESFSGTSGKLTRQGLNESWARVAWPCSQDAADSSVVSDSVSEVLFFTCKVTSGSYTTALSMAAKQQVTTMQLIHALQPKK